MTMIAGARYKNENTPGTKKNNSNGHFFRVKRWPIENKLRIGRSFH